MLAEVHIFLSLGSFHDSCGGFQGSVVVAVGFTTCSQTAGLGCWKLLETPKLAYCVTLSWGSS